jgi:hypothetical protein
MDETVVSPDGNAAFANRAHSPIRGMEKVVLHNGPTRWHLWWIAPPTGTGAVTLYAALVDGNGGGGTAINDQDPTGDDVVQGAFTIPEQRLGAAPTRAGCAIASANGGGAGALSCFWIGIFLWRALRSGYGGVA